MKISNLGIDGAWLIEPNIYIDNRGSFHENFNRYNLLNETGIEFNVAQCNISKSHNNVIRGIHFSLADSGQSKLVGCISGSVQDVVVDIRIGSKTFGKWISIDLNSDSNCYILISGDLGHAFQSQAENTRLSYLVGSEYSPKLEWGINPLDKDLDIKWRQKFSVMSQKDVEAKSLKEMRHAELLPIFGRD